MVSAVLVTVFVKEGGTDDPPDPEGSPKKSRCALVVPSSAGTKKNASFPTVTCQFPYGNSAGTEITFKAKQNDGIMQGQHGEWGSLLPKKTTW